MKDYTGEILATYNKLGFTPRDNQVDIINNIINSFLEEGYTNVILSAGTGHGKSIIGMVTQMVIRNKFKDGEANVIMNTNVLIDQYINSFSHLPVNEFAYRKGANNYVCPFMSAKRGYPLSAEYCVGTTEDKCSKIYLTKCEFCKLKQLQKKSKCVVSNYSYWMTSNLFTQKKNHVLINVFDECHTMNDVFSSFASLSITTSLIDYLIKFSTNNQEFIPELNAIKDSLKYMEIKDEFNFAGQRLSQEEKLIKSKEIGRENYNHFYNTITAILPILMCMKENLEEVKSNLIKEIKTIKEKNVIIEEKNKKEDKEDKSSDKIKKLREALKKKKDSHETLTKEDILLDKYLTVSKAHNKISNILYQISLIQDDDEILFEKINENGDIGIKATPVFIKKYWSALNNSAYNLFMSATVTEDYIKKTIELEGNTKFIHIPSSFPKQNKVIVSYKPQKLNYISMQSQSTIDIIINSCEEIVKMNHEVNGIILTTNFGLAHKIAERIRKNKIVKVFEHKEGEKIADVLKSFKESTETSVLISPSLWEGISLNDDASRYQIVCKTPYGSLASKRNKFIQVRLPEIYQQQTLLTLIQGFGRSVRNKDDFCFTFCLDSYTFIEINKPYNIWHDDYEYMYKN